MRTWWIDEPVLMGSSNPTDSELEQLRRAGFTLVVSLLAETKQKPNYDPERAAKLVRSLFIIHLSVSVGRGRPCWPLAS